MACNWIDRYWYFSMPAAATFIVAMPRSVTASTTGRPICTVEFTRVVFGPSSCTSNICASCCASMSLMYSTLPCSVSVTVTVLLTVPISGLLDAETSVNCFDPISVAWRARSWLSISAESCAMSDCRNCERSEEHTSELQSRQYLVCRLLLEKKNKTRHDTCSRRDARWLYMLNC